jgi:hypothetical protein
MLGTMLLTVCTGLAAADAPPARQGPPAQRELFSREDWYRGQEGKEQDFVGTLQMVQRKKGVVGFGRFNPYYLVMESDKGQRQVREVYVGGQLDILQPYVGRRVRITGKPVDMEVEGRNHREIWPARIALAEVKDAPPGRPAEGGVRADPEGKQLKVIARARWPFVQANPDGDRKGTQTVVRSAEDLVNLYPWNQLDAQPAVVAKMASAEVAKLFKVDAIDWQKQMLVVVTAGVRPTGGWQIDVKSLDVADNALTVKWSATPPAGFATQAFTHPAVAVLTERFEGKVRFAQEAGVKGKLNPRPLPPRQVPPQVRPLPPVQVDPAESPARPAPEVGEKAAPGAGVQVIAQSPARMGGRANAVIRSAEELAKAMGGNVTAEQAEQRAAQALKVKGIDWTKQMLLTISGGTQRTGGYSVVVKGMTVKDKVLTVQWFVKGPRPGTPVTQALTNPSLTVLVERFDGEVRFDPPAAKGGLGRPIDRQID